MTTGYISHPLYAGHDVAGHPERPARIQAVWEELERAELLGSMTHIEPCALGDEELLWVHSQDYIALLHYIANHDHKMRFDGDTLALPETPEIARLSAGGVARAVQSVMRGEVDNALAVTRPPGHHAIPKRAMGFCYLSNVAIAARCAQKHEGAERVMIVDYDVHHGNGTQDIFYDDDSVLFISTHQYPLYPGSGAVRETGQGDGMGYTINVPMTAGHGDADYMQVYKQIVWPAARRFQPDIIIVSAGFDAHWYDPLAMMNLSLRGLADLTRELILMAEELTGGKIVFVMEGGYDLNVLSHGVRNIAHALIGEDKVSDPFGVHQDYDLDMTELIDKVKSAHNL